MQQIKEKIIITKLLLYQGAACQRARARLLVCDASHRDASHHTNDPPQIRHRCGGGEMECERARGKSRVQPSNRGKVSKLISHRERGKNATRGSDHRGFLQTYARTNCRPLARVLGEHRAPRARATGQRSKVPAKRRAQLAQLAFVNAAIGNHWRFQRVGPA